MQAPKNRIIAIGALSGFILFLALAAPSIAQTTPMRKISFRDYLRAVEDNSLDLQAQRETIVSAKAGIPIAGVSPDPQLTAGIASKELYGPNKPNASTATTAGIAFTIETAGKRNKRIRAAQSNVLLVETTVEGAKHQLYEDAASSFAEACRAHDVLARQESTLKALSNIVGANDARRKAGDISGLELAQSRVERDRFGVTVTSARATAQAAIENLSVPLGKRFSDLFGDGALDCEFQAFHSPGNEEDLIQQALQTRADIRIARATLDNARNNSELARANRWSDPIVNVGITNTPRVDPIFDGAGNVTNSSAERSKTLGLTVTIPIPLSRMQHGELIQAESAITQAALILRSVELKTASEVRRTYAQFLAAQEGVQRYRESVLVDTDKVLDGMRLSYRKGATSLLELLSAQRSTDEVHLAYLQAVADLANAAVRLQLSIGQRPAL